MSTPAVSDLSSLPGSEDDPNATSTSFWFILLGVFLISSTFALTYLAQAWMTKVQQGVKAPGSEGALKKLYAAQDNELHATVNADKLYLKNGTVVEGIVVDARDSDGNRHVLLRDVRYEIQGRALEKTGAKPDPSLGKPIADYTPDEVLKVERQRGKKLAVPIGRALELHLRDLRK